MDNKQKKPNNKTSRLLLMLVVILVLVYAGSRLMQSTPQTQAPTSTQMQQTSAGGGLTLLTDPPQTAKPEQGAPTEAPALTEELTPVAASELPTEVLPEESGSYLEVEDVAYYLHTYGHLPDNYMTKSEAEDAGWVSTKGNLWDVSYGSSIGGDRYWNSGGQLPKGEKYYEADVNYDGGYRGGERIVYTDDGDVWYTDDHYESFERLY